jgi:hypothetical protein
MKKYAIKRTGHSYEDQLISLEGAPGLDAAKEKLSSLFSYFSSNGAKVVMLSEVAFRIIYSTIPDSHYRIIEL